MVLIPPDVAIRMRMQTESNLLQPVQPSHEIPSDVLDFTPGQTFNARIQETLPDNTYRALVAGRQLTLQLPEGAKPGDSLELVVIDRSAKAIIARQVDTGTPGASTDSTPYAYSRLSPAARLISQLLPAEGEQAPAAPLNRGQPLLAQAPMSSNAAALLAPALGKAVAQSGVFYEAHQAQWVSGQLALEQLLMEPQGRLSAPVAYQHAAADAQARATPTSGEAFQGNANTARLTAAGDEQSGAGGTASSHSLATSTTVAKVPEELRPLVQQQLEAASTNRMFWHGEVWPGQTMDWAIEWDGQRGNDGRPEESMDWRTALTLTTPRLGRVNANLQLTPRGIGISLVATDEASVAELRGAAPLLAAALEASGVPLQNLKVQRE